MVLVQVRTDVDYNLNRLINARIQAVAGLPSANAGNAGWLLYNTADNRLYYSTGTSWELRATNSDALGGQNGAYYLNRANHTGTQPASSISNFNSAVQANPINTLAAATGPLDLGGQRIINGAAAVALTDFATLGQVSDIANNLGFKHVRAASTGNVVIASTGVGASVDGVTLALNDRLLLKDQTLPAQNGVYTVGASSLSRSTDADTAAELPPGTIVVVEEGTANHDQMWMLTTNRGYVMGTDALTFSPYGLTPNPYTAGNGISIASNVISAVAGTGIVVTSGGIAIDPAIVGRHFEVDLPAPGSGTAVTVTHNLNRRPIPNSVMEVSTGDGVQPGVNYPDANSVTFDFAVAPTNGQYRVSIG